MKRKTILLTVFTLTMMIGTRCEKEPRYEIYESTATITYSELATDGCGWKVNIDAIAYHPINLDDKFKINDLNVNLKYNLLYSDWECPQWTSRTYKEIKIISIIKIN